MTISARRLPKYFDSLRFPVTLYELNSKIHWKEAGREELELLIALDLVFGVGSWTRLRRIFIRLPGAEVAEALLETPEPAAGLDLDLLQRMVSARKTVFREHLFTTEGGVRIRSGRWAWSHKRV